MQKALKSWLVHQCHMLSGVVSAFMLTGPPDKGPFDQAQFWPQKPDSPTVLPHVAQAALRNKQAIIKTRSSNLEKTGEPLDALACPIFLGETLLGVIAFEITHRTQSMQQALMQQIQAGTRWIEILIHLQGSAGKEQLVHLVDMVAVGLESEQFKAAAAEVTNELAARFGCHRVSLGFLRNQRVRIEAISHSSSVDQHANATRALCEAQLEALDQGDPLVYPPPDEGAAQVTRFHERLARAQGGASILTLPLVKSGKAVGALLLERSYDTPFEAETVAQCKQIGLLLGPLLETRRRDERPLVLKMIDAMRSGLSGLLGPRCLGLKLTTGLVFGLLVWLCLASTNFRISCDSELEARARRVIAAPQAGYIATAQVRSGDLVRAGDLLATLDEKDLRLEERKWQSQRAQLLKEYRKALSGADRAEVAIINAKRGQAEAQLKLIEQQLARTKLVAPFSGLVVEGDLSQALGSPVTRGEVLYQVAPTDGYRVVLKVDDRDIGLVAPGQKGRLKLSGIPDQQIEITIERLTPVSSVDEGRNYFRVEAVMAGHSDLLRPGMQGISKVEIGRSKLIWAWTRRLVEGVRLFAWRHLP